MSNLETVVLRALSMGEVTSRTMRVASFEVREASRGLRDQEKEQVGDDRRESPRDDH